LLGSITQYFLIIILQRIQIIIDYSVEYWEYCQHKEASCIKEAVNRHSYNALVDGALPNGSITVFNACQLDTRGGRRISVGGYAYRPVEAEKGKLEVVFAGLPQRDDGRNCKQRI